MARLGVTGGCERLWCFGGVKFYPFAEEAEGEPWGRGAQLSKTTKAGAASIPLMIGFIAQHHGVWDPAR
jgi:hypothetical protein